MNNRVLFATFAIVSGLLYAAAPAFAQEAGQSEQIGTSTAYAAAPAKMAPAPTPGDNTVFVPMDVYYDGQTLMRIRTAAGGLTAGQRVNKIHERIALALADTTLKPGDVRVRPSRLAQGGADILVGDRLLVVVDPALAQANGTSAGTLARIWAADLKRCLPEINVYNPRAAQQWAMKMAKR